MPGTVIEVYGPTDPATVTRIGTAVELAGWPPSSVLVRGIPGSDGAPGAVRLAASTVLTVDAETRLRAVAMTAATSGAASDQSVLARLDRVERILFEMLNGK